MVLRPIEPVTQIQLTLVAFAADLTTCERTDAAAVALTLQENILSSCASGTWTKTPTARNTFRIPEDTQHNTQVVVVFVVSIGQENREGERSNHHKVN